MQWDREQHTSLPRCSDGPIFTHEATPSQQREQDPSHQTQYRAAAEAQGQTGRAASRAVGFGFNSTATTQLCSADTCPEIHQKLLKAVSTSFQAQPHTARQFSFCQLSNSCPQCEQNMPQGKPRDMSTPADRFCRNPSWDGLDSPVSQRGATGKEPSAQAAFLKLKPSNSGFSSAKDLKAKVCLLPCTLHPTT